MIAPATEAIKPGIYRRQPMEDYLAIEAVGSSFLRKMEERCPWYAKWRSENDKRTPTMQRGSALSCRLLEPEFFDELYVVTESCGAIVQSTGRRCPNGGKVLTERGWRCGVHGKGAEDLSDGRESMTEAQLAEIDAMAGALRRHPEIREVLEDASETELTVVWKDKPTGLPCKARIDVVAEIRQALYDVKTAASAAPEDWPWVMKRELYHVQAAHHLAGARAVGLDVKTFGHLVVENSAPYLTAYRPRVTHEAMQVGEHIRRDQLTRYAECVEKGWWPGYPTDESDLPPFYMKAFLGPGEV